MGRSSLRAGDARIDRPPLLQATSDLVADHRRRRKCCGAARFTAALIVLALSSASSQTCRVSGHVSDASNQNPLPATTVRVIGTSRGTIANGKGDYQLSLEPGRGRLVFSFIGYRSDTLEFILTRDTTLNVRLAPAAVELPEVVVTGEDPAIAIMRKVIAGKAAWQARLKSYRFEAFTRQVLWRDTAIASITESYSLGYWKRGDTLREVIRQRRQTENVPVSGNFASVGTILNFYDDDIRFAGFSFVGPTSPDAFADYNFRLEQTRLIDGRQVFVIALHPSSRFIPLFDGTISILDGDFALVGVRVRPNEAFVLPFVSSIALQYEQQFRRFGTDFWLPVDIITDGRFTVGIPGISLPALRLQSTSSIYDYEINPGIPDSVGRQPRRLITKEADAIDSTFWATHAVLPLTVEEREAYRHLDSTQTLEKQLKPSGPLAALADLSETWLRYLDIRFNRVEGLYTGVDGSWDLGDGRWRLEGGIGYGMADTRWNARAGIQFGVTSGNSWVLAMDARRGTATSPDNADYGTFANSIAALTSKNDYEDYYRIDALALSLRWEPLRTLTASVGVSAREERTAEQRTDFSLFYRASRYRPNPPADEGRIHSLTGSLRIGDRPAPLGLVATDALSLEWEAADSHMFGGDFTYRTLRMTGDWHLATFFTRSFLAPQLVVRVSAGGAWGGLPRQHATALAAQLDGFAPFGVFHGMEPKEFTGDGYLALHVEHNFRSVPFTLLGFDALRRSAVEVVAFFNTGRTWWTGALSEPPRVTRGWYSESGVGISRILGFFRIDIARRFTPPASFALTVGIASIL